MQGSKTCRTACLGNKFGLQNMPGVAGIAPCWGMGVTLSTEKGVFRSRTKLEASCGTWLNPAMDGNQLNKDFFTPESASLGPL